jgi:hypothetical protein
MLTLKSLREDPQAVIDRLRVKNFDAKPIVDKVLELDAKRRALQMESDALLAEQKKKAADGTPVRISEYRPEEAPTMKVDGPLKIEAKEPEKVEVVPEKPKIVRPLQYNGYTVRCIEGKYGRFYWDYEYNRLNWTTPEGEDVAMSPQAWKTFCIEILPEAMAILGVPFDE